MKLAKALKVKNRLVGEVNRLRGIFRRENSRMENSASKVDVAKVENELSATVEKLITVKTAITKANIGIYEKICRMDELKSKKSFYQGLNTTDGEQKHGYGADSEIVNYVAHINQEKADLIDREIQIEIDNLQDEIDEYNATTEVDIEI